MLKNPDHPCFKMPEKYLWVYLLFCVICICSGQQTFHRTGDNYNARVAIRRYENLPTLRSQFDANRYRRGPWRQGDRITKQEVIQNLARTLLTRKMTTDEMLKERKKDNQEKLHEYAMYQARLAKESSESQNYGPNSAIAPAQYAPTGSDERQTYQGSLSQQSQVSNNRGMPVQSPQEHANIVEIGHIQQNTGNGQRQVNSQQWGGQRQHSSVHVQSSQFTSQRQQEPARARP